MLPEHWDAPAFGTSLGDALPESARFDEIAALVDIAKGRGVALELPGVLQVTGFEGQGEMFHLGGSDGAFAPVGGSNPAWLMGTFCICMRGTSPPSTGGRFSSARTSLMVITPLVSICW